MWNSKIFRGEPPDSPLTGEEERRGRDRMGVGGEGRGRQGLF